MENWRVKSRLSKRWIKLINNKSLKDRADSRVEDNRQMQRVKTPRINHKLKTKAKRCYLTLGESVIKRSEADGLVRETQRKKKRLRGYD